MAIEGINLTRLLSWMEAKGLGEGPLTGLESLTGGSMNILAKFERAGRSYVLRRPPVHLRKNSNETMRREARVLKALSGSDVPHPELIRACDDEGVLGAVFYLMEPVDGFNPADGRLPAPYEGDTTWREALGLSMVDALAKLHRLDYRQVGLEGFGKPEGFLDRQVDRWRGQLESYAQIEGWPGPAGLPHVAEIAKWLEGCVPADFSPGILHGDFLLHNVMARPNKPELAAIIDWELATVGDPLLDLGWLIASWPSSEEEVGLFVGAKPWDGFPKADDLVAAYAARSDRDLTHLQWYVVMACYKLAIILEGTYARSCAGKAPRNVGEKVHKVAVALLNRALDVMSSEKAKVA